VLYRKDHSTVSKAFSKSRITSKPGMPSSNLFILVLEILAVALKNDKDIIEVEIKKNL
jgi:hypothetical protein